MQAYSLGEKSELDQPKADGVSGAPIAWTHWVAKRGPVAVLVWASWAPSASSANTILASTWLE